MSEQTTDFSTTNSPAPQAKTNVFAVISFFSGITSIVFGILSIISFMSFVFIIVTPICAGLGVVPALIAFISSVISLVQVNKSGDKGKGMAITGLLLSILYFIGVFTMSVILVFISQSL
jgi:hypothetical protein